jgi:hypothetical protein
MTTRPWRPALTPAGHDPRLSARPVDWTLRSARILRGRLDLLP